MSGREYHVALVSEAGALEALLQSVVSSTIGTVCDVLGSQVVLQSKLRLQGKTVGGAHQHNECLAE